MRVSALPRPTSNGVVHSHGLNAVGVGELVVGGEAASVRIASSGHSFNGKLGLRSIFTLLNWMPTLLPAVLGVVLCGASEEVIGAHAGRIIASVANHHAALNLAVVYGERESVSLEILPVSVRDSVPILVLWPKPLPATVSLLDLGPESFNGALGRGSVSHTSKYIQRRTELQAEVTVAEGQVPNEA
jgi:hypothetical protein